MRLDTEVFSPATLNAGSAGSYVTSATSRITLSPASTQKADSRNPLIFGT